MITWIQNTLQHHFRIVFAIILAGVIISFVFITNASSGLGHSDRKVASQPLYGYDLAKTEDQQRIFGDAGLSVELTAGYAAIQDQSQLQQYALHRITALTLADSLRLKQASKTELEAYIKTLRAFMNQDGTFDATRYNQFTQSLEKSGRVTAADVARVLNDNLRIQQVEKLLGGPGYVIPAEIKDTLSSADSSWSIAVATLDYASYAPALNPTEDDLTKFFENNPGRFTLPEQIRVSYAEFPGLAYVSNIQLTDPEIRAYYDANPARFPKPTTTPAATNVLPATPDFDFATVKSQVEAALKLEQASRLATKAASDFALSLYSSKTTKDGLAAFLASRKITAKDAPAFSRDNVPASMGGSYQLADEAFKLDANRYFSDAIPTQSGAVVLFWQESFPSRQPLIGEVREKVIASYKEDQKRTLFAEAGKLLRAQLETRLKAGDTLEKAAAATTSPIKVEVKAHGPFTLRQPPQGLDRSALTQLENLNTGALSTLTMGQDGKGYLVHAIERKLPDLTDANPEYKTTLARLSDGSSRLVASELIDEHLAAELKKHAPAQATP